MYRSDLREFHFRAVTTDGDIYTGTLTASSVPEVAARLRASGHTPLRVSGKPIRDDILTRRIRLGERRRLTRAECVSFAEELAVMLDAGVELEPAAGVLASTQRNGGRLQKFWTAVRQGMRLGKSLAASIQATGYQFPSDFLPTLQSADRAGRLIAALRLLSSTYAEQERFSRVVFGALAYPLFLIIVSIGVLGIIALFVAPSLASLFVSLDRPVPTVIGLLYSLVTWTKGNTLVVAGGAGLTTILILAVATSRSANAVARSFLHRVPGLGEALRWACCRRFAATLRLQLLSNVAIGDALQQSIAAANFPSGRAREVVTRVRAGGGVSVALQDLKLPAKVAHLLRIGETSGRLPEVLSAVVDEANIRFERRISLLSSLFAPLMIAIVGVVIGSIVFSVFSALLEINQVAV